MATSARDRGWLLLMHQLPPHPSHLRVKVWRRLAGIGAVALKNSVYVLPKTDAALEDLHWVRREILDSHGEATIVEANFISGVSDHEVEELFRRARDAEYDEISKDARALNKSKAQRLKDDKRRELEAALAKLEQRFTQAVTRDFFGASKRDDATALLEQLRARLRQAPGEQLPPTVQYDAATVKGRTWVTRTGVKVDRIASAWLILRFIDPEATFKLVAAKGYEPHADELRFDMFDAEFSHEGEDCTFETLCHRFKLRRPGLRALAEIIHDIDLKDHKFNRPEAAGLAALIDGLVRAHESDDARLTRGLAIFDDVLAHFSRERDS